MEARNLADSGSSLVIYSPANVLYIGPLPTSARNAAPYHAHAADCGVFEEPCGPELPGAPGVLLSSSVILRPRPSGLAWRRVLAEWLAKVGGGDVCLGRGRWPTESEVGAGGGSHELGTNYVGLDLSKGEYE